MQYVGFDIHKHYTFYTQIDAAGQIQRQGKLTNTQEAMAQFFGGVQEPAEVVIEAGINWYHLYDLLEELGVPVTLAHPLRTRAIASAKVKTDKIDSATLAQLLRADLIPAAYIPPRKIRDLRELLRYRAALVRLRTAVKNRIHAILLKHGYQAPVRDVFGVRGRGWLATLSLRPVYQQALRGYLQILDVIHTQVEEASEHINQEAKITPAAQTLCTLPGVGPYTALLILAEIGEVTRFPSPKHLVSYAGLAPTVHASGGRIRTGHISKQGSPWLRWILMEAAFHASCARGPFRERFQGLAKRKGAHIARVAVARELLIKSYWMLRHVH